MLNRFANFRNLRRFIHQRIEFSDGTPVFESRQFRYSSYGISWTTLAMINSALAGNDGGSSLGTFVLSLGFGPLVTLYLAVTSGQRQREFERRMLDLAMK